jgi:L-amino acid N-acyltransferase YncA
MKKHPSNHYLANINPENHASKELFKSLGFSTLQETYSLRREDGEQ